METVVCIVFSEAKTKGKGDNNLLSLSLRRADLETWPGPGPSQPFHPYLLSEAHGLLLLSNNLTCGS